jgi:hypothetical protein
MIDIANAALISSTLRDSVKFSIIEVDGNQSQWNDD